MSGQITNALPDIPRVYTAICEWLACMMYVAAVPRTVPLPRTLGVGAAGLVAVVALQYLAGTLPLTFWILGMCLAFGAMWLIILFASGNGKRTALFLTARAFVLAELVASLHWQIDSFIRPDDAPRFGVWPILVLVVIYGVCFAVIWLAERHNFSGGELVAPTAREALTTIIITLITFAMSNLSFISTNTPFSGTVGQEVFYIRTLVDLCGFVMLYAQQEQIRQTRASLELASINASLQSQHAEYLQSKENIEAMGRLAHDLKHQIVALRAELDPQQASAQFERLEASVNEYSAQQHSGNPVLDVILTTKTRTCNDRGITFTMVADGKLLDGMDSMDIATLFGNALDNAIEATSRLADPEQRLIKLALHRHGQFAVVRVENYYDSTLRHAADGSLRTTKRDTRSHGFGVKSIRHIARQYGGEVTIDPHDHWFDLHILLPLPLTKVD
ncbi:GHKL domain-containing protein [Bifidobacterium oedipodis]|uniref:Two-component sensor histidine kinase n=1 Tax=Bifidobacterium oedipodis TaxID=2675322 RepID=A0A7Y0ER19_9BIFI|nr:GHKL domain-containing protein [Bifidobacterium sp. DSM 109957]NMM94825.1 two-component sensor histidine kinase [Bifidobacterium sp. DSM 109957]